MQITQILPYLAGGFLAIYLIFTIISKEKSKIGWIFPAFLSLLFFSYSVFTVSQEGPIGFWVEHTRNFWGNQIWFDLLLAASIGWYFILPKARELKMNLPFWAFAIVATGSIGFTAMVSRLLYLEEKREKQ
ncbi:MAG TPA: hypothetical protein PK079_20345 [Leptospiraceae bacterium]|nr:hypothetical protein [Leptospiraceae bacterium]HMW07951.1 hypothetical protein [Leptospiraceae bacterium]HMX34596.1 hypothetical protein [Leptospiraceae bacterium]HMY34143.1 hypothetical protein [Leptospiraceae bacterium]HMZ64730.1 hypothetical protein [Leptospiraceae bacterium]